MIDGPGNYIDRKGRPVEILERAPHNSARWMGVAGDGEIACFESDGVMECSQPSDIDVVAKANPLTVAP